MKFSSQILFSICLLASPKLAAQPAADPADAVFKNREDNRFLFKWNASALQPVEVFSFPDDKTYDQPERYFRYFDESHLPASLSLEGLVAGRWSVQANIAGTFFKKSQPVRAFSRFGVEGRWHLVFLDEAKSKRRGANLNGIYTGLDFSVSEQVPGKNIDYWFYHQKQTATVRLGFQSRFLRSGFFDASLGMGREKWLGQSSSSKKESGKRGVFAPRLNFGWAVGSAKNSKIPAAAGDFVFQKNRTDRQFFKFDLLNLFKFRGENSVQIKPSLAWQARIFGRFSVEFQAEVPMTHQKKEFGSGIFVSENTLGLTGGIEPRCIFAGHKKGSLNGWFLGWNYSPSYLIKSNFRKLAHRKTFVLGLQSRLFEKGFIEYKTGFGNSSGTLWETWNPDLPRVGSFFSKNHLFSEMKAGMAF